MDNNKKNMLYSYFENGFEKGLSVEKAVITVDSKNSLTFSGNYSEERNDGYLSTDIGSVRGRIISDGVGKIAVEAHYTGKRDGFSYDYSRKDAFEVFETGLVYRVSVDSRDDLKRETYYKTHPETELCDYITNCSNPITLSQGDYEIAKVARK